MLALTLHLPAWAVQSLNREALLRVRGDMLAGETKVGVLLGDGWGWG